MCGQNKWFLSCLGTLEIFDWGLIMVQATLNLKGFNLNLLYYNCDYGANHGHIKLSDHFGSSNGDKGVHLSMN